MSEDWNDITPPRITTDRRHLVEIARLDALVAELKSRAEVLTQEANEWQRQYTMEYRRRMDADKQNDWLRQQLEQLQPIISVIGDWNWPAIANDEVPDAAIDSAVRALAHVARERAK